MNARVGIVWHDIVILMDKEQVDWSVLFGIVWWCVVSDYALQSMLTLIEKAWSQTK